MARLVPNPVGDVVQPLRRVELAVASLSKELNEIKKLPEIHAELVTLNATMGEVLEALHGLRPDSAGARAGASGGGKRKPRAGGTSR
jgi:hypothetical protein